MGGLFLMSEVPLYETFKAKFWPWNLDLAFRWKPLRHFDVFPIRSEAAMRHRGYSRIRTRTTLQGYLAHKETPTPLGPPLDPRHRPTVGS